jgi:hypothetical protein
VRQWLVGLILAFFLNQSEVDMQLDRVQAQRISFLIRAGAALVVLLPVEYHLFKIYDRVEASYSFNHDQDLFFTLLFVMLEMTFAYGFGLLMGSLVGHFIHAKRTKK